MQALVYRKSIPRYLLLRLLGRRMPRLRTGPLLPLSCQDMPEPALPNPGWVRVAPSLSGICGSDLATLFATGSPYLAPLTSMPFVMGHEVVGRVTEAGANAPGLSVGDRVVLQPALGCRARGIEPPCDACDGGHVALCRNVTRGNVSRGIQTGFCRDTGGAFGQSLVAHPSQLYRVPDELSDEAAVLIEPFACALHGALRVTLGQRDTALVIGCGSIGLLTIAALRAIGCRARIVAVAKYDHQREHALSLGADELIDSHGGTKARYASWAKALDAEVHDPELGKPTVIGGAAATFDCVASARTIDDGIRFTKSGGDFVLVGMPGIPVGIDWTPLWFAELTVHAAYAYGTERLGDRTRPTFDIAIEQMRTWGPRLARLVGPPHELADFRAALRSALSTGLSRVVKTTFVVNS